MQHVSQHLLPCEEVLIVGGEDHKVGQADDAERRFGRLEHWARLHFPELQHSFTYIARKKW